MSDLRELYQEVILDHNKNPRNFREITGPDQQADGHNPLCGDNVTVYLRITDDVITDISFLGSGCAISKASASLMTAELSGKTVEQARRIFNTFHDLVTTGQVDGADEETLGKLAVFGGVSEYPARVKCASLPWHTAAAALNGQNKDVSTE